MHVTKGVCSALHNWMWLKGRLRRKPTTGPTALDSVALPAKKACHQWPVTVGHSDGDLLRMGKLTF